jgi:hypothetical protein
MAGSPTTVKEILQIQNAQAFHFPGTPSKFAAETLILIRLNGWIRSRRAFPFSSHRFFRRILNLSLSSPMEKVQIQDTAQGSRILARVIVSQQFHAIGNAFASKNNLNSRSLIRFGEDLPPITMMIRNWWREGRFSSFSGTELVAMSARMKMPKRSKFSQAKLSLEIESRW